MIARKAGPSALAILLISLGCSSPPTELQEPPVPHLNNSSGNPSTGPTYSSGNALAEMADDKLPSWTLSHRIDMPVTTNSPPTSDR